MFSRLFFRSSRHLYASFRTKVPIPSGRSPTIGFGCLSGALAFLLGASLTADDKEVVDFVVIGKGEAARAALLAIREEDKKCVVAHVEPEDMTDYSYFTDDESSRTMTASGNREDYLHELSRPVNSSTSIRVDFANKTVTLEESTQQRKIAYRKALLTVGGVVPKLKEHLIDEAASHRVLSGHALDEAKLITALERHETTYKAKLSSSSQRRRVLVVGGGTLSTMTTDWLLRRKLEFDVDISYKDSTVLKSILPTYVGHHLSWLFRISGMNILPFSILQHVRLNADGRVDAYLRKSYDKLEVARRSYDAIVLCHLPSDVPHWLLQQSLRARLDPLNGGIITTPEFQAARDVYVAGDVVSVPIVPSQNSQRAPGRPSATSQVYGRLADAHNQRDSAIAAAKNMVREFSEHAAKADDALTTCRMRLERCRASVTMLGLCDASADSIGFWRSSRAEEEVQFVSVDSSEEGVEQIATIGSPFSHIGVERGVIYYTKADRIVGILLYNLDKDAEEVAREILSSADGMTRNMKSYSPAQLRGLIHLDGLKGELRSTAPWKQHGYVFTEGAILKKRSKAAAMGPVVPRTHADWTMSIFGL